VLDFVYCFGGSHVGPRTSNVNHAYYLHYGACSGVKPQIHHTSTLTARQHALLPSLLECLHIVKVYEAQSG
jgi:hypothetical protein